MKNKIILTLLSIFIQMNVNAQIAPIWTQTLNVSPSPDYLYPQSTKVDINGDVIVLCTQSGSTGVDQKIFLRKFTTNGNILWTTIFDNGINGNPRGFDMAVDSSGNIYVAGGLMTNDTPLVLKFNSAGTLQWQRSTITAFAVGSLRQIILKNGLLYTQSSSGVAVFDINGNEQWSAPGIVDIIAVDNAGRLVASVYNSTEQLIRYNIDGSVSFRDSTIFTAGAIAIGYLNDISIISDYGVYEVAHLDSAGNVEWRINTGVFTPPFGDIGVDIVTDFNNDVIAIGLNDTMIRYNYLGDLIWKKSMNGLDGYMIQSSIFDNNYVLVSGVTNGFSGYDIKATLFDYMGNETWSGQYNSNTVQEFSVEHAFDQSGIYILEDSVSNSTLIKFEYPLVPAPIDFSLICVDSIWYDPLNPSFINISVFNGNVSHLNYPSIQMGSPQGDTISNVSNSVLFFAHLGNTLLTYTDSITEFGITDFSDYHFYMSDGFGDTTVEISFCLTSGIWDPISTHFNVYPNPATGTVHIIDLPLGEKFDLQIFDTRGQLCYKSKIEDSNAIIDLENLSSGLYILKLTGKSGIRYGKVIKQ